MKIVITGFPTNFLLSRLSFCLSAKAKGQKGMPTIGCRHIGVFL